jgi:hypothetical protein
MGTQAAGHEAVGSQQVQRGLSGYAVTRSLAQGQRQQRRKAAKWHPMVELYLLVSEETTQRNQRK